MNQHHNHTDPTDPTQKTHGVRVGFSDPRQLGTLRVFYVGSVGLVGSWGSVPSMQARHDQPISLAGHCFHPISLPTLRTLRKKHMGLRGVANRYVEIGPYVFFAWGTWGSPCRSHHKSSRVTTIEGIDGAHHPTSPLTLRTLRKKHMGSGTEFADQHTHPERTHS